MPGGSDGLIGSYLAGMLDAHDIPRKQICAQTRIHESTLSRKINGVEDFKDKELLCIGVAIGKSLKEQKQ